MNVRFLAWAAACLFCFLSCSQDKKTSLGLSMQKSHKELGDEIQLLKDSLAGSTEQLDKETALQFIMKSEAYALAFPMAADAAETLFRAADVARGIGEHKLAIDLWTNLRTSFSESPLSADALFMIGFTQDADLNSDSLARISLEFLFGLISAASLA